MRLTKRVRMVTVGGVVWWWSHYGLYTTVVEMHWPMMVMVDNWYWYVTNYWHWDWNLSHDRLINRHGLKNPLN